MAGQIFRVLEAYADPIFTVLNADHFLTSRILNERYPTQFPRSKRSSMATSFTVNTVKTKSTGPYDPHSQQNLIDGGVYNDGYEYPDGQVPPRPANWKEIKRQLLQPRPLHSSSTFPHGEFENFIRAHASASKQKQVSTLVIPFFEGDIGDPKCVLGGISFTNLERLTNGTLVPGNLDIFYGSRPEQFDRRVREELNVYIIPSIQNDLPITPNFFLAVRGPNGSAAVAKRQAYYDGGAGARGIHTKSIILWPKESIL